MSLLSRFFTRKSASASTAKDRLQIVLAHERAGRIAPEFLPVMQQEILQVVGKYFEVTPDMLKIDFQQKDEMSMLEIEVELDKAKIKQIPTPPKVEEGFVPWKATGGKKSADGSR